MNALIYPSRHDETWPCYSTFSDYRQENCYQLPYQLSNELFLLHWSHCMTVVTKRLFVSIPCYLWTLWLTCFVAQWCSNTSTRSMICSVGKSCELVISVAWYFELDRPTSRGHLWYYFVTSACGTRIRNDWRLYLSLFSIPQDMNNHQSIFISAVDHRKRHLVLSPSQYSYFAQQMPGITSQILHFPAQQRTKGLSSSVHSSSLPITVRQTSKLALYRRISHNIRPHVLTLQDRRHTMKIWLAGMFLYRRRDL